MQNRLSKQIFYGILFIFLVVCAVGLGYFLIFKIGQDKIIPLDLTGGKKEIQVESFKEIASAKSGKLSDYLVELRNPNENLGAQKIKLVLGKTKKEAYLLPLEKKFAVIIGESKKLSEGDLKITETVWVDFSKEESAGLAAQNKKFEAKDETIKGSSVSAVILNRGKFDLQKVEVDIIVYNFAGEPIAINCAQIDLLLSGEERAFKVFWPNYLSEDAGNFSAQISSNIMDKENIKISGKSSEERF
ncbi:MAG: hypothetical protein V1698_03330 [bacterium]